MWLTLRRLWPDWQKGLSLFQPIIATLAKPPPEELFARHNFTDLRVAHHATLCFDADRGQPFTPDFIPRCASLPCSQPNWVVQKSQFNMRLSFRYQQALFRDRYVGVVRKGHPLLLVLASDAPKETRSPESPTPAE